MDKFKCKRCGKCCGVVSFTRKEYKKIQRKAKKMKIAFVKKEYGYFTKKASRRLDELDKKEKIKGNIEQDLICPFLFFDKKGLAYCEIYEDRPKICRDFGNGKHPYLVWWRKYIY